MSIATEALIDRLTSLLLNRQHPPRYIQHKFYANDELLHDCLQEAIALRELNQSSLSLELLTSAQQLGLESPWLLDNQARALVDLGRRQAAWEVWQHLSEHNDSAVAENARSMADIQETFLLNTLESLCAREGWVTRHMSDPDEGKILERVLKEIITARELNATQLSLDLATEMLAQGWQDPWLLDNQARALVDLGREPEALKIWRELQQLSDLPMAAAATDMVALYEQREARRQLQEQCAQLAQEGQVDSAKHLLLNALLQDPQAQELRLQLSKLLKPEPGDLLHQELEQHEAALAVHEGLLDALEAKLTQPQN